MSSAEIFFLLHCVIGTVMSESEKSGNNSLRSFSFKKSDYIVICKRMVFNKNFTDNTDSRLNNIGKLKLIKFFYDISDIFFICTKLCFVNILFNLFVPLLIKCVCRTGNLLIRSCSVKNTHEQISVYKCLNHSVEHSRIIFESGIFLKSLCTYRNNGYLLHSGILKSLSYETDIVCCSTATACLCYKHSSLIKIIFSGFKCLKHLADNDKCRIAGIIIYIFKTEINAVRILCRHNDCVKAACIECRTDNLKMYR